MKCELCRDQRIAGSRLCVGCGDMIRRLIVIDNRLRESETCEAERLRCQSGDLYTIASNAA